MTEPTDDDALDLIWGAKAIAVAINRTPKQAFNLLEGGHIPPARKAGGKWVVSRRQLRELFEPDYGAQASK